MAEGRARSLWLRNHPSCTSYLSTSYFRHPLVLPRNHTLLCFKQEPHLGPTFGYLEPSYWPRKAYPLVMAAQQPKRTLITLELSCPTTHPTLLCCPVRLDVCLRQCLPLV